jgi:hypothetical protein
VIVNASRQHDVVCAAPYRESNKGALWECSEAGDGRYCTSNYFLADSSADEETFVEVAPTDEH